jgi:hypothetical protein
MNTDEAVALAALLISVFTGWAAADSSCLG